MLPTLTRWDLISVTSAAGKRINANRLEKFTFLDGYFLTDFTSEKVRF